MICADLKTSATPIVDDLPFRLLADHLPALCFMADAAGQVRWCNRRWYDYTCASTAADPQHVWPTAQDPQSLPDVQARWEASLRSGKAGETVILLRGADARYRPFLTRVEPVRGADGTIQCWLGTMTEIGEQRAAEQNQQFLVQLGDLLRDKIDPAEILFVTGRQLGTYLGLRRVGYGEIEDGTEIVLAGGRGWEATGEPRHFEQFRLDDFGSGMAGQLRRGDVSVIGDTAVVDAVGRAVARHLAFDIRASITVPLVKNGRLAALLYAQDDQPRAWRDSEVALVREVAERTWATLERARAEAARNESERKLRDSEARLRAIVDATPECVKLVARDGALDYMNAAGLRMIEADADALGRDILDVIAPEHRAHWRAHHKRVCAGESQIWEFDIVGLQGTRRRMETHAVPLRSADGRVQQLAVTRDITDRKTTEAALAESEERFRGVFETAHEGIWLVDQEGRTLFANERMAELLGTSRAEMQGRAVPEYCFPEDMEDTRQRIGNNLAGHPEQFEFRFRRADGSALPVLAATNPLRDGQGRIIGAVGMFSDLSDSKRAEAELQRSREALYQSEKLTALGSLLAGVSHELNNPLSVVLTLSELLEQKAAGTPFEPRAAKIHAAAARCAKIVQTFLAIARQRAPERSRVSVSDLVADALELTGYSLRTSGIRVVEELAPALLPVEADADQLGQVLVNLIVNAQHALAEREGDRRLTLRTSADARRRIVRIQVEDNGPGVAPEIRRRIFEPFFTSKPQGQGTGIGLTFSLGIVEAHGGPLRLEDRPAGGACFTIELPACADDRLTVADGPDVPARAPCGRALVIDDEPDLADALAEMLVDQGYRVDIVRSGEAAKQLIAANDYAAILSDLRMPGVDGPALLDWIEERHPAVRSRLAFVTGDTLGPTAARFLDRARRPTLEKPFDRAGLRRILAELGTGRHG